MNTKCDMTSTDFHHSRENWYNYLIFRWASQITNKYGGVYFWSIWNHIQLNWSLILT